MTRYATVEGVGRLAFPDDTPDDVMDQAVAEAVAGRGDAAAPAPPPRAMTHAQTAAKIADTESPWSWDAMTGRVGNAFKTGLDAQSAMRNTLARSMFKAGEIALMPSDVGHDVSRFIMAGDYSPSALQKSFVYGPNDPTRPSADAEAWLDAHTQAPQDVPGMIAENVNAALLGAKFPGMPSAPRPGVAPLTAADKIIAAGEKHNVPVYFDDLTKSAFAKRLGVGAEYMPIVGTSAGRAAQGKAAMEAATQVASKYAAELKDDVPQVLQKGLQDKLNSLRATAGEKYTAAGQLLDSAADVVPTPRFVKAIRRELLNQRELGTAANPEVVEMLKKYQLAPEGNFTLARNLRSQLKSEISDFYSGAKNKAIGQPGVDRLRDMRDALEADMAAFAKKTGGKAYEAWKDADNFYRTNLVPFKEVGFADLVKTAEPEKAWRYLMTQGGIESRAERMYNGLTEPGRAAVRSGVVNDAMANAVGPKGTFSPARFAKYMEDHSTVVDKFFQGSDKEEINGFTKLMRHVDRAGQYMENPPTGQRAIGAMMLGSLKLSPWPLAISTAAAGGTRVLFQTQRGRDLLLAASKLKPGSAGMNIVGNRIGRLMISGAMAGRHEDQQQQEPADADTQ